MNINIFIQKFKKMETEKEKEKEEQEKEKEEEAGNADFLSPPGKTDGQPGLYSSGLTRLVVNQGKKLESQFSIICHMSLLVNTTPHAITIRTDDWDMIIEPDKKLEIRADPYYKEVDDGSPYKTFIMPLYKIDFAPIINKIKETDGKCIFIVSSIVANVISEEIYTYISCQDFDECVRTYGFKMQIPNTNPEEVIRDEKGVIKGVKSMITYYRGRKSKT